MAESSPITMHFGNPSLDETTELIELLAGAWMGVAPRGASIMPPGLSCSEQHRVFIVRQLNHMITEKIAT